MGRQKSVTMDLVKSGLSKAVSTPLVLITMYISISWNRARRQCTQYSGKTAESAHLELCALFKLRELGSPLEWEVELVALNRADTCPKSRKTDAF